MTEAQKTLPAPECVLEPLSLRRAKIVCTLGPSSNTEEDIRQLMLLGMDVARLNFSHGTHDEHLERIRLLRRVAASLGRTICILQDLQGPKIRTSALRDHRPVELVAGARVTITNKEVEGTAELLGTTFKTLAREALPGTRILLSDGRLSLKVLKVMGDDVLCEVVDGGLLGEHQGINLPGAVLSVPSLTSKDKKDLAFGLSVGVDMVAISFVRSAADVRAVKKIIAAAGGDTPVIAKLEKPQAIDNLDEILAIADGVMVAASDHYAVGNGQNLIQIVDGLRLFQLGDDRRVAARSGDDLFNRPDIGGRANKGDGNHVHAYCEPEGEVFLVLGGERWHAEHRAGQIDALMLAEQSAIHHLAQHIIPLDLQHLERETRQREDARTGQSLTREGLEGGAEEFGGALHSLLVMVTREPVTSSTGRWSRRRWCESWGLAGLAECRWCDRGKQPRDAGDDAVAMFVVSAVGEVQACHVHAQQHQLANIFLGVGRRDRGYRRSWRAAGHTPSAFHRRAMSCDIRS